MPGKGVGMTLMPLIAAAEQIRGTEGRADGSYRRLRGEVERSVFFGEGCRELLRLTPHEDASDQPSRTTEINI